ncbi:hypothetical protein FDECE_9645 [Fusarium decemcellulare]|nr:hypothetical protein FDECE_9645 [Fusarium decemcellulare]
MFIARQHARTRTALLRPHVRYASRRVLPEMLEPVNKVTEQLAKTQVWTKRRGRKPAGSLVGDGNRLNIVSQDLCDDIINYLGPSLERHRGCDLVDLNPGVGLWSRALHAAVQPRKHIMMEHDAQLYKPFLKDLVARPNVHFIPKAGILWRDLNEMLETCLPHQKKMDPAAEPERNDTLLVSVNLAFYPPKKFLQFECVSTMVLYQLMSSIRSASLFQQYGRVRMLFWINDDGKRRIIPRSCFRRKRAAFEAELACEWVHEVAGKDVETEDRFELRDEWINMESGYRTLDRMKSAGLTMPSGRETFLYNSLIKDTSLAGQQLAGKRRPIVNRPFRQELDELEAKFAESKDKVPGDRLKQLRFRERYDLEDSTLYLELQQERDRLLDLWRTSPDSFPHADVDAWNARIDSLKKNSRKEFITGRDNYHVFRQDPPAMSWDRRAYEPLAVRADEFYPQVPCTLLDVQPKPMSPWLRQHGPNSNSGNMADVMLRHWFNHMLNPVSKAMDSTWPGFGDLMSEIPSLIDPDQGGSPLKGNGELVARLVNEKQWADIVQTFVNWPFAPKYRELVGRLLDDHDAEGDESEDNHTKSGAQLF